MFRRHLQNLRNKQNVDGKEWNEEGIKKEPKKPQPNDILYGEIAVNYGKGYETLFIKNSNDEIISFPNLNDIEQMRLVWGEF